MNWLERARTEITKSAGRSTAVTAERNPAAVLAVPHPAISGNSQTRLAAVKPEIVALLVPNESAIEPDPDAQEHGRLERLREAVTEKSGMFLADGCSIEDADRLAFELVQCRDCRHYRPDAINPPAGMGTCAVNADRRSVNAHSGRGIGYPPWPAAVRICGSFTPRKEHG